MFWKKRLQTKNDAELRRFCLEQAVQLLQGRSTTYLGCADDVVFLRPMDVAERLFRYIRYGEVNDYKELFYL